MEIQIEGEPKEIIELLQAIVSSQEQLVFDKQDLATLIHDPSRWKPLSKSQIKL